MDDEGHNELDDEVEVNDAVDEVEAYVELDEVDDLLERDEVDGHRVEIVDEVEVELDIYLI